MTVLDSTGKRYTRTDQPEQPHERERGQPASPWLIPTKGAWGKRSGLLATTHVAVSDTTFQAVAYPKRGGVYDRRVFEIAPRPQYQDGTNADGTPRMVYKVECTRCGDYQKREAFSPDSRKRNGLMSICKSCRAMYAAYDRQRRNVA